MFREVRRVGPVTTARSAGGRRRATRWAVAVLAGLALPVGGLAQGDDAAYCAKLGQLALRYGGGAGGEGRLGPDLATQGALTDCSRGNTAAGIAVLEKKLRGQGFTLPPR